MQALKGLAFFLMLSCPARSNGIPSIFNQQQNSNSNNNGLGWLGFHLPVSMRISVYSTGKGYLKRKKSNLPKNKKYTQGRF